MMDLDILLSMVENPTRRKILESLVKEPHYPLQLSKELGISQQAVMKNLNMLEKNGMVVSYQVSSSIGPMRTSLSDEESIDELGRMLGAGEVTDAVRQNAREMRTKALETKA